MLYKVVFFSNCVKTAVMFSLRSMSEILQPFPFFTTSEGTFLCTGDTLRKRETLQMWSFLVFRSKKFSETLIGTHGNLPTEGFIAWFHFYWNESKSRTY